MSTERAHRGVVLAVILVGYLLILIDVSILMAALPRILVTVFGAAGSPSDGARALLAERVSATMTAAGLFLALALAVTLATRTTRRATTPRTDVTARVADRPCAETTLREDCAPA